MKTKRQFESVSERRTLAVTAALVCWLLLGAGIAGAAVGAEFEKAAKLAPEEKKEKVDGEPKAAEAEEKGEDEEDEALTEWRGGNTEFTGWANFTFGGVSVSGNEAEFRRRMGIDSGLSGGLSEFFWETFVGDNGTLQLGASAVGGNEDYDFHVSYENSEIGYLRAGVSSHRTWSNGGGGFFPTTGVLFPLNNRSLYLDRRKVWIEGGLTLPDKPVLSVRYERSERFGDTDSTIWGATPLAGDRGVSAAFRGVDERRDIFTADVTHMIGKSDVGAGFRYERTESDNSLNFQRDAGALTEDFTTQKDGVDSDLFSFHAHSSTRLLTNATFSTAYSFTRIDTGVTGSRILGASFDPVFDPALARFPGFVDLHGGSRLNQHVAAFNLHWLPTTNLSIVPSVRVESTGVNSDTYYTATPSAAGARNVNGGEDFLDLSERLEVRYTGLRHWVLYGRGDWDQGDGDLQERQTALATGVIQLQRDTDFQRFTQKYTAGANWYPARRVNVAGQYYYKRRENDYDHLIDTTSNVGGIRYPAYLTQQDFDTHDFNVRLTLRPSSRIVSVSRYDFQLSGVDTGANGLAAIQSADLTSHVFSQSLTWTPITRLYLQGTMTYVHDTTETPTNSGASGAIVPESRNNFWNFGFNAGYALGKRTDLDVEYLYYLADNFIDNSAASQPYGAEFEEHRVVTTLSCRISENKRLMLQYGFFRNDDTTFGGDRDYLAHLVSSTFQCRF